MLILREVMCTQVSEQDPRIEVEKIKIAVGDYNRKIDERIAKIKEECDSQ